MADPRPVSIPVPVPAPTRIRLSSQERREAIVAAALSLFAEKGFRGATTRELAAAAGVSEPVLYEHFRTKRDLYTAIIDLQCTGALGELERFQDLVANCTDDRFFFDYAARLIVDWYEQNAKFVRILMYAGLEGHELKDIFYEKQSSVFIGLIISYAERRVRDGALRIHSVVAAVRAFMGMVAHACLMNVIFSTPPALAVPSGELIAETVRLFLDGILAPNSPCSESKPL